MTILQYMSAFRLFGGDVLVLGLAVTIAVSVLKKTIFKNAPKKLFVFLPFLLGTLAFAAFRCIAELSVLPLTDGLAETFEGGFACGCAATLYYVVYEQFLRVKQSAAQQDPSADTNAADAPDASVSESAADAPDSSVSESAAALLRAFISADLATEAADALCKGHSAMKQSAFPDFVSETLARYAPTLSEEVRKTITAMMTSLLADKN